MLAYRLSKREVETIQAALRLYINEHETQELGDGSMTYEEIGRLIEELGTEVWSAPVCNVI